MNKILILLFLIAGCGGPDGNEMVPAGNQATAESSAAPAAPGRPDSLTGLYEGAPGETVNQLCMIDKGPGAASFGLVVWGSNLHSCSGAGDATRQGDKLILAMAGDSACRIEAKISGGKIDLPAAVPAGCAYYCGARAALTGAAFTRKGATREDALKATDLAGDRLCGGATPG